MNDRPDRRRFLTRSAILAGSALLAGCEQLSRTGWFSKLLGSAESLNRAARNATKSRISMAQEFSADDLSPSFRSNGTSDPSNPEYRRLAAGNFADYRLEVGGHVQSPMSLSLSELRALPARTQITRHDCVEGWSAIGKWRGARLGALLEHVRPLPSAKFVVFHCADSLEDGGPPYYESIDMEDAYHEQTLLAYEIERSATADRERRAGSLAGGTPTRLQNGEICDADRTRGIVCGARRWKRGYWEDQGYQWYAGI